MAPMKEPPMPYRSSFRKILGCLCCFFLLFCHDRISQNNFKLMWVRVLHHVPSPFINIRWIIAISDSSVFKKYIDIHVVTLCFDMPITHDKLSHTGVKAAEFSIVCIKGTWKLSHERCLGTMYGECLKQKPLYHPDCSVP